MIVAVTGGRHYKDRELVFSTLNEIQVMHGKITILFSGGASGADFLAEQWAKEHDVRVVQFQADWDEHGRAAGPIRNREMMQMQPDMLIAFPGGKGTYSCIQEAVRADVPVYPVEIID